MVWNGLTIGSFAVSWYGAFEVPRREVGPPCERGQLVERAATYPYRRSPSRRRVVITPEPIDDVSVKTLPNDELFAIGIVF